MPQRDALVRRPRQGTDARHRHWPAACWDSESTGERNSCQTKWAAVPALTTILTSRTAHMETSERLARWNELCEDGEAQEIL